jgi:hypothetical protein
MESRTWILQEKWCACNITSLLPGNEKKCHAGITG